MVPARDCLSPLFLHAPGARLRAAIFDADPDARPRGACALLNGQTEFIEKYFEVIDALRQRGFAVAALDWRGQGGSSRLLPDAPLKAHIDDFASYDQDLAVFWQVVFEPLCARLAREDARPVRRIGMAHSMGGHVLLRALHANPKLLEAALFSAPMLMFSTRGQPRWLVRMVTNWMNGHGHATDWVWGMADRDPLAMGFADQIVTSDPARFARTQDFLKSHPGLRLAGPTWGWVAAAYRSLAGFARPGFAEAITTPVFIGGAGKDRICVTDAARRFAARMPQAVYLEIADGEHELLMERDPIRGLFWAGCDAFLAERGI